MHLSAEDLCLLFTDLGGMARAGTLGAEEFDLSGAEGGRRIWEHLATRLAQGERLSDALRGLSPQIDEPTLAILRAGEEGGDLADSLEVLAAGHRRRMDLERCTSVVTIYPMIVILVMLGALVFFANLLSHLLGSRSVVAHFTDILSQTGAALPPLTLFVIRMNQSLGLFDLMWLMATPVGITFTVGLAGVVVWLIMAGIWRWPKFQRRIAARLPGLAPLLILGARSRWAQVMGHLLRRRKPLSRALQLAEPILGLKNLERESRRVREMIEQGLPFSLALGKTRLLPLHAVAAVAQGERSGHLGATLQRLADHLNARMAMQICRFEAWLEPVLIILLGGLVLCFLLNFYILWSFLITGLNIPLHMIPRIIR